MGMAIPMPRTEEAGAAGSSGLEEPTVSLADRAMERYANGDERAFETVYDEIAPMLERFFDSRAAVDERPDLIAETFLTMHRRRGTFIRGSAVLPWAIAIAERLLAD